MESMAQKEDRKWRWGVGFKQNKCVRGDGQQPDQQAASEVSPALAAATPSENPKSSSGRTEVIPSIPVFPIQLAWDGMEVAKNLFPDLW